MAICEYRLSTGSTNTKSSKYLNEKLNLLHKLADEFFVYQTTRLTQEIEIGELSEALFFIQMQALGVDIKISNREQDQRGIDFFISEIPVDVTGSTLPKLVRGKLLNKKSVTLLLPRFEGQRFPFEIPQRRHHTVELENTKDDLKYNRVYFHNKFLLGQDITDQYTKVLFNINQDLNTAIKNSTFLNKSERHTYGGIILNDIPQAQTDGATFLLDNLSMSLHSS